jgi:methionine synthase II (cobalamin-independent)
MADAGGTRPEPRAETVGSLLRSKSVAAAARRNSLADQEVLSDAMIDAVRLQEEAGVDVITDGEVRRTAWAQTPRFLDCFTPVPGRGALNWRGGTGRAPAAAQAGGGYPAVTSRVSDAVRLGDMAADYELLTEYLTGRGGTPPRAKFTMPAPSYHRRYWSPEHSTAAYGSAEEYLEEIRDYLREVVDRLTALGCDYIQLDAPNYGSLCDPDTRARMAAEGRDPQAEIAFDAELDNSLFAGVSGITTALHICRGNGPGGAWHSTGGYAAISGALFPRLEFSRLLLEYDSDRSGGFEPLKDASDGTIVVLGLLTTKSGALDDEPAVEARIAEAARLKPLRELALSTQCGFASVPAANPVTPDGQRAKLEMVARIARRLWG